METPIKPSGGQPETLPAEISAKRPGAIRMSIHIPENWNPHADLLAIADLAAAAGKRADRFTDLAAEAEEAGRYQQAEDYRQAAREAITRENMREINFAVCLLAMRLSGCSITLPAAEAEQQRRADEAAEAAAIAAASGSSATRGFTPDLAGCAEFAAEERERETDRLRKTIALADEAIREASTLRSSTQPGETAGETQERWNNAHAIETAATACRKAARKALASLVVFPDKRSPEQIREQIETTRTEALALKHAIDLEQRDKAHRQIRLAAREAAQIAADCAAIEAGKAAAAARKKGGTR